MCRSSPEYHRRILGSYMSERILHLCENEEGAPLTVGGHAWGPSEFGVGYPLMERGLRHRASPAAAEGDDHYRVRGRCVERGGGRSEPRERSLRDCVGPLPGIGPAAGRREDGCHGVQEPVRTGETTAVDQGSGHHTRRDPEVFGRHAREQGVHVRCALVCCSRQSADGEG